MISQIEALNYRCLQYVRQELAPFHVLVGPNASGKTTFLDVIAFLGRVVSDGLEAAIAERTTDFRELLFAGTGESFELAIEAIIPEDRKARLKKDFEAIRYELKIGFASQKHEIGILGEKAWLLDTRTRNDGEFFDRFPRTRVPPASILHAKSVAGWQTILTKAPGGNDNFYIEMRREPGQKSKGGWFPSIRLGSRKSALGNLPDDESKFPASTWLRSILTEGVRQFTLNSNLIRRSSPPILRGVLKTDGSNLPWVVQRLEQSENRDRLDRWIAHVRTALPDVKAIRTVESPDTKHRHLVIEYDNGLIVPSWTASDGTLRLLALTILAYLPDFNGVCLIEEPENGIHPCAVETVYQSLSSIYESQILLATHSPVILSLADVDRVLCFDKNSSGATDIVKGSAHPALRDWRNEVNLGALFAGGVLG
jgi:predicted ATPase